MATDHVVDYNYNPGLDVGAGWDENISWDLDGELHDEIFQGDFHHCEPSFELDESFIEPFSASSAPSFDGIPNTDALYSWQNSCGSGPAFSYAISNSNSNSWTDSLNDRVLTQSYDPSNQGYHRSATAVTDDLSGIGENPLLLDTYVEVPNAIAIPIRPAPPTSDPNLQDSTLDIVQCEYDKRSRRMGPSRDSSLKGQKARGRKRGLSPKSRKHAALMRIIGSCTNCKRRKEKCDPGTPCRSCVVHFKNDLVRYPCRGVTLEILADSLLNNQVGWHPTERTLDDFLGPGKYIIGYQDLNVPLNLGFGPLLHLRARVVYPNDESQLYHVHCIYSWPPRSVGALIYRQADEIVLPAILSEPSGLGRELDDHLSLLVNQHFKRFPLFCSPFHILRDIYILYLSLPKTQSLILHQALKLLVLVHVGDIVQIPAGNPVVQSILDSVLTHARGEVRPTPCFIRGQLGAVIPNLARNLMKDILTQLERLSLSRDCKNFEIILSTTALLLMTVESVQYHAAKEPYHASLTRPMHPMDFSGRTVPPLDDGAAEKLLHFYRICYSGCHERLQCDPTYDWDLSDNKSPPERFLDNLRKALGEARPYLVKRSHVQLERDGDMSCFFDRLLARLFLGQASD